MLGSAKTNLPLLTLTSWVKGTSSFGKRSQLTRLLKRSQKVQKKVPLLQCSAKFLHKSQISLFKKMPSKVPNSKFSIGSTTKKDKNHNFSFNKVSTMLDVEDLILETFRYCENVRDLGFQEYWRSIFSGLVMLCLEFSMPLSFVHTEFFFIDPRGNVYSDPTP